MTKICCPFCGKVLGEKEASHIVIKKINIEIYGARAIPRTCPGCGRKIDLLSDCIERN